LLTAPRILYLAQRGYSQRRYDDLPSVLDLKRRAGQRAGRRSRRDRCAADRHCAAAALKSGGVAA
jgi:hypothetical protein